MPTATQVTKDVQERVLDTVKVGQKGFVDFVRSWSQTVEAAFAQLPEISFTEPGPRPTDAFESAFSFTERFFAAQREFAGKLFEAALPATRAGASAANAASAQAKAATR